VARRFLNSLVRQVFPKPLVEVTGSAAVDVVVNRVNGELAVNLVNTAGPHADKQVPVSVSSRRSDHWRLLSGTGGSPRG